jgi:hypothetical protein
MMTYAYLLRARHDEHTAALCGARAERELLLLLQLHARQHAEHRWLEVRAESLACIRRHTSAYVGIRQHMSAYVSIRQHTSAYASIRHAEHRWLEVRAESHTLTLLVYEALRY